MIGDERPDGGSWTLALSVARRFADVLAGPRGLLLGIARPDGSPTVWRGSVDASQVLAYFGSRREQEVVLLDGAVRIVWPRAL